MDHGIGGRGIGGRGIGETSLRSAVQDITVPMSQYLNRDIAAQNTTGSNFTTGYQPRSYSSSLVRPPSRREYRSGRALLPSPFPYSDPNELSRRASETLARISSQYEPSFSLPSVTGGYSGGFSRSISTDIVGEDDDTLVYSSFETIKSHIETLHNTITEKSRRIEDLENIAAQSNQLCKICYSQPCSVIYLPCCHFGMCRTCHSQSAPNEQGKQCPFCRTASYGFLNCIIP